MSDYYLDSSALAKRYLPEIGTVWVRGLVTPTPDRAIWIAEITEAEVAAALAARHRAPRGITLGERDAAIDRLAQHCSNEYRLIPLTRPILDVAITLTRHHRLRAYDAVQLATALTANDTLRALELPDITFITADSDLITAARAEGLDTDNPNQHS